jgi:signal peptide peptidase SppA
MNVLDILNEPWAIVPEKLEQIHAVYQAHLLRTPVDFAALEAQVSAFAAPGSGDDKPYAITSGVAILPVRGVIARRMNLMTRISGGVSTELLTRDFQAALADPEVDAILLDVDSPGGSIGGLEALTNTIYNARGTKPVVAWASDMMASAAYWIASAADLIVAEGTSAVGSIGVLTIHYDYSRADERAGVKRTYIASGRYKAMGNDAEPLSDEARQETQARLDYIYTLFVDTVARNRGADHNTVLGTMADGRIFIGRQALDAGLADRIGTIDDALRAALSMAETDKPKYFTRR